MQAQQPAEGILLKRDFGDAVAYRIDCECGQDWHAHDLWVEAESTGINVTLDVTVKTDFWSETVVPSYAINNPWLQEFNWALCSFVNGLVRRVKLSWLIWRDGYVAQSTVISMSPQQALNYADTMIRAVTKVAQLRAEEQAQGRKQFQGDCV